MKDKIIIILFLIIIYGFFLLNIVIKDNDLSIEERRHLKEFPSISMNSILNGDFMDEFEDYTLDQFPFRNMFRSIKANSEYKIFHKLDNNSIFIENNKIFKIEYPLNEKNVIRFTEKVDYIIDNYLDGMNIYYAIIPDKNYYLENDKYLKMDYNKLYEIIKDKLSNLEYIELRDLLSLDSYYDTDTHWKQEELIEVASRLEKEMVGIVSNHEYQEKKYEPFYGVYYGQAALGGKGEVLTYFTNDTISNAYVENISSSFHKIYKLEELGGMDSYNMFLSGSTPIIRIENKNQNNERELFIFRDSFASSLTPLLLEQYSNITLIDLRYISASKLNDVVDFKKGDVLFLYSTMIINQSVMLKD